MSKSVKIINKITKIIMIGVICYLGYLAYFAYEIGRYGHSMDWKTCKQYLWVFKDSVIRDLKDPQEDHFVCASGVKKRDVRNTFHYYHNKEMYIITVWEFKDLASVDLNNITIKQNINLSDIKFISGETFDAQGSSPVTINYGFVFHNELNINLDSQSEITGTFDGSNYKGFYGEVHRMVFSNEKDKPQIIFDHIDNRYNHLTKSYNPSFSHTVFLVYKGRGSFYVIIINSKKPFKDTNIINILNLQ